MLSKMAIRLSTGAGICLSVALIFTSCRRAEVVLSATPIEAGAQSTNDTLTTEFRRLVVSSNMTVVATESAANKLCRKISELPDKKEAVRMYDQLLEMAIDQYVSETNYNFRQNWYCQLWFVAMNSFMFAQGMRDDPFEGWNRLLRFFGKYTNEIEATERTLPTTDSVRWKISDVKKGVYLHGLKGDFKTWVHVMKDLYFAKQSKGLTDEQKADVYRRLDELNKYTITPTNFPGGRR